MPAKTPKMPALRLLMKHRLVDTHWGQRIVNAELRGKFSDKDVNDSYSWTTCACGQQDPRIPRFEGEYLSNGGDLCTSNGAPKDRTLNRLGIAFPRAIDLDNPLQAAEVLVKIEARSAAILAGVEAKARRAARNA